MLRTRGVYSLALFIGTLTIPTIAHADTFLDSITNQYQNAGQTIAAALLVHAQAIFFILAFLQFFASSSRLAIDGADLQEWAAHLVRQILMIGFYAWLMQNAYAFGLDIINSFRMAVTGSTEGLSPSNIFSSGLKIGEAIAHMSIGWNPFTGVLYAVAAVVVVVCFAWVAALVVVALCEAYILIAAGVLLMGLGASEWTRDYANKNITMAMSIGAKLLIMQALIATGQSLLAQWGNSIIVDDSSVFRIIGGVITFVLITWSLPNLAQTFISGSAGGATAGGAIRGLTRAAASLAAASTGVGFAIVAAGKAAVASEQDHGGGGGFSTGSGGSNPNQGMPGGSGGGNALLGGSAAATGKPSNFGNGLIGKGVAPGAGTRDGANLSSNEPVPGPSSAADGSKGVAGPRTEDASNAASGGGRVGDAGVSGSVAPTASAGMAAPGFRSPAPPRPSMIGRGENSAVVAPQGPSLETSSAGPSSDEANPAQAVGSPAAAAVSAGQSAADAIEGAEAAGMLSAAEVTPQGAIRSFAGTGSIAPDAARLASPNAASSSALGGGNTSAGDQSAMDAIEGVEAAGTRHPSGSNTALGAIGTSQPTAHSATSGRSRAAGSTAPTLSNVASTSATGEGVATAMDQSTADAFESAEEAGTARGGSPLANASSAPGQVPNSQSGGAAGAAPGPDSGTVTGAASGVGNGGIAAAIEGVSAAASGESLQAGDPNMPEGTSESPPTSTGNTGFGIRAAARRSTSQVGAFGRALGSGIGREIEGTDNRCWD